MFKCADCHNENEIELFSLSGGGYWFKCNFCGRLFIVFSSNEDEAKRKIENKKLHGYKAETDKIEETSEEIWKTNMIKWMLRK